MNDVPSPVNTLSTVYYVFGAFQAVVGVGMGLLFGVLGFIPAIASGGNDDEAIMASGMIVMMAMVTTAIIVPFSAFNLAIGYGLRNRRSWGRIAAFVASALMVLSIPIGTAIAVYTFMTLTKPEVTAEFS